MFYGLSGFFAAHSQHVGIVQAAAWLPWLVLAIDMLAERVTLRRLALAGLLGAMLALPGHFQTALYAFCGVAVWAVLELRGSTGLGSSRSDWRCACWRSVSGAGCCRRS